MGISCGYLEDILGISEGELLFLNVKIIAIVAFSYHGLKSAFIFSCSLNTEQCSLNMLLLEVKVFYWWSLLLNNVF